MEFNSITTTKPGADYHLKVEMGSLINENPGEIYVPTPIPGIKIVGPQTEPLPGQAITHYELVPFEMGCTTLNFGGAFCFLCCCFTWIPCGVLLLMRNEKFHRKKQRPVYGPPLRRVPRAQIMRRPPHTDSEVELVVVDGNNEPFMIASLTEN